MRVSKIVLSPVCRIARGCGHRTLFLCNHEMRSRLQLRMTSALSWSRLSEHIRVLRVRCTGGQWMSLGDRRIAEEPRVYRCVAGFELRSGSMGIVETWKNSSTGQLKAVLQPLQDPAMPPCGALLTSGRIRSEVYERPAQMERHEHPNRSNERSESLQEAS